MDTLDASLPIQINPPGADFPNATRVTSDVNANALNWSTMDPELTDRAHFKVSISPSTSTSIFCVESPQAAAVVTLAIDRT